jgi:tripartite-type tricarboxylate transporter receptor subunit TctC
MIRKTVIFLALAGATLAASAADWPAKPITLSVPTAAGGGTDTMARLFADRLGKVLGQQVIVDNRPGANGMLGTELASRAAPDGHTLLFTYTAAHVVNPSLYKKISYDALNGFAPIAQIGRGGNVLLVRPELPVSNLKQFAEYVKARPGKVSYCSWGNGSGGHLAMESFKKQAGLDMTHVPYKGSALCVQDLIGGQVQAAFGDTSSNVPHIKAGRVKALAISGPSRVPQMPEVPTMNEAGFPFTTYSWYGLFAPAGTPAPVVRRLNAEVVKLLQEPAMKERLAALNFTDLPLTTPEQFAETVRTDMAAWARLVKDAQVSLE